MKKKQILEKSIVMIKTMVFILKLKLILSFASAWRRKGLENSRVSRRAKINLFEKSLNITQLIVNDRERERKDHHAENVGLSAEKSQRMQMNMNKNSTRPKVTFYAEEDVEV